MPIVEKFDIYEGERMTIFDRYLQLLDIAKEGNKKAFLDGIENDFLGGSGLEVAYRDVTLNKQSRWRLWQDVRDTQWWVNCINQRRIASQVELVFDLDDPDQERLSIKLGTLKDILRFHNLDFVVFKSGGKGLHVHAFCPTLASYTPEVRSKIYRQILQYCGADSMKASKRNMIQLEYSPHHRSGIIKEVFL